VTFELKKKVGQNQGKIRGFCKSAIHLSNIFLDQKIGYVYFKASRKTKGGEIKILGLIIFNAQYSIIRFRPS
jgi:hypothetical protein